MKDSNFLFYIKKYLSKFDFISNSKDFDLVCFSIEERISETDSEEIILNKIYDVLFYYFSGSHVKNNPINIKNFDLLSKLIKSSMNSSNNLINDILNEINNLNIEIDIKNQEIKDLYSKKQEMIFNLQKKCPHDEYIDHQYWYQDEYGSSYLSHEERKCILCSLIEKGKLIKSYNYYDNHFSYNILNKKRTNLKHKKFKDYNL